MKGEEKLWAILNEKLDNLRATNRLPQAIRVAETALEVARRAFKGNQTALATTEFNLALSVKFSLTTRDGKPLAGPKEVTGTTSFFVTSDPTTDERQALPLATEDLATRLVTELSEGW